MLIKKKKRESSAVYAIKPVRILAIIQLCLSFALILSRISYPFMGDLFEYKAQSHLFQYVMGFPLSFDTSGEDGHLLRSQRFSELSSAEQQRIRESYQKIQASHDRSFMAKTGHSLHLLAVELPMFERAWIALSIAISLLLLLRQQGANYAAWLLPLVCLLYGINNIVYGYPMQTAADAALFPSEATIISSYLREPLSSDIEKQRQQLLAGWREYLIRVWVEEEPSKIAEQRVIQEAKGEYAFNLARLQAILSNETKKVSPFQEKKSVVLLMIYFLWNLSFAFFVNKFQDGADLARKMD